MRAESTEGKAKAAATDDMEEDTALRLWFGGGEIAASFTILGLSACALGILIRYA
ncbi:MAG: hypothetical protein AAGA70_07320 [Pseudomonadota bacterium]